MREQDGRQFRQYGWCVVEGLFAKHAVAALAAEVARFRQQGLVSNVRTEGDGDWLFETVSCPSGRSSRGSDRSLSTSPEWHALVEMVHQKSESHRRLR
jgi:hypothetical protein